MLTQMLLIFYLVLILMLVLTIAVNAILYKHGTYAKMTGTGYFEALFNLGKRGEYLTYKELKLYESDGGRFIFNCYLPKEDGTSTEVDVVLLHSTGIFVIESKNYSGWIYGSEKSKTWTQTLRGGSGRVKKEHFYNPIMQNRTHIKYIKNIVGNNVPVYSLIAFSQRCTLKEITVESPDVEVINRQHIFNTVKKMGNASIQALSKMDIERIYEMLYPYTQVTEYDKLQHIDNVNAIKHGTKVKPVDNVVSINAVSTKEMEGAEEKANTEDELIMQPTMPQNKRICPRCGSELVLRTAKKGKRAGEQFYGCSRFPKCMYSSADL